MGGKMKAAGFVDQMEKWRQNIITDAVEQKVCKEIGMQKKKISKAQTEPG